MKEHDKHASSSNNNRKSGFMLGKRNMRVPRRRIFRRPSSCSSSSSQGVGGGGCRLRSRRMGRCGRRRSSGGVERANLVQGAGGTHGVAVGIPTGEEHVYNVEIPRDASPGKPIALFVEGARVGITCPLDAQPGQVICFRLGANSGVEEEATAATWSSSSSSSSMTSLSGSFTRASRRLMRRRSSSRRRRESRSTTTTSTTGSTCRFTASSSMTSSLESREEKANSMNNNKRLNFLQVARIGYRELVHAIIRPPRADYKLEALGPVEFFFCGGRFRRHDFELVNLRGQTLKCSHWKPIALSPRHLDNSSSSNNNSGDDASNERTPVVIYMHGNASARVEVVPQALSHLLSLGGGVSVVAFDFAGSGHSDGDYVSLGYHERDDLQCVISHLRSSGSVSTIALWGRSMGAATALMHADRDPTIAGMVLDSPFCDLTQLAMEMAQRGRDMGLSVPPLVVGWVLRFVRASVRQRAKFDVKAISPLQHADKSFVPALFVAGHLDTFIDKSHSQALHARYAGDKNLILLDNANHNSPRPAFLLDSVRLFLQTCLQIPAVETLHVPPHANLMVPPWLATSYSSFAPEWLDDDFDPIIPEEPPEPMHPSKSTTAATTPPVAVECAPPEQAPPPPPPPRARSGSLAEVTMPCSQPVSPQPATMDNCETSDATAFWPHLGFTPQRQWQVQASFLRLFGGGLPPPPQQQQQQQRRASVTVHTLD